jgi:uroporphyrinogen-III synthase
MGSLTGKRILITRASGQIEGVASHVYQRGGVPIAFPCLAVTCLTQSVREAVKLLGGNGVQALFTSANGVNCVATALGDAFIPTFQSVPVVVIGRHTADAIEERGVRITWMPQNASQEGLMDTWRQHGLPMHLVFFRAEQGRNMLPEALKEAGVDVHLVPAYRTICPNDDASAVIQSLKNGDIDAVLLGSSRTAQHYVRRVKKGTVSLFRSEESKLSPFLLANRPAIAVISEQVADTARTMNLDVQVVAKEASFASMLDGLELWFQKMAANGESHA